MSYNQEEAKKDAEFRAQEAGKMWKMARFRPEMDFMKAKRTLGINLAKELYDLDMGEIFQRFVALNTMVRKYKDAGK